MNNFIYKIVDYLKEQELGYPVHVGIFDESESVAVVPMEGSQIIHEYMNGSADIRLPFEVKIKSRNQEEAFNVLSKVMNHMRSIGDFLESEDKEHSLLRVVIDQIPAFVGKQEDGCFYYNGKVTVDLSMN